MVLFFLNFTLTIIILDYLSGFPMNNPLVYIGTLFTGFSYLISWKEFKMARMISTEEMVEELSKIDNTLNKYDSTFVNQLKIVALKGEMYTLNSDTLDYLEQLFYEQC